ncbi:MAG: phosphoglucosamine mutase [Desulfobacteraceae bacterium]|jgi:phosphoglucosamine mutase
MAKLFGTDGIRGIAGQYPIDVETGKRLGYFLVGFCKDRGKSTDIITGRDTRESGEILEKAVSAGILAAGGTVKSAGEIPTPGAAFLAKNQGCGAGVVISASHNPFDYNGFKIFSGDGYKFSEAEEIEIEDKILDKAAELSIPDLECLNIIENAKNDFRTFLQNIVHDKGKLKKYSIVIDCSNGAASGIAPTLFNDLGVKTDIIFAEPDGKNINDNCGSQHTGGLSKRVIEKNADIGLAFDGDADRLIAVDETGTALTGDQIIAICAKMLHKRNELNNNVVVTTVMSNMGLGAALKEMDIDHEKTGVGDRLVMEKMREIGSSIGGEDSGHIIFANNHTTGDGILSALQLLNAMAFSGKPLSKLADIMKIFPQVLINVKVKNKPEITGIPAIKQEMDNAETALGDHGRILVRYSGTEPLCRIMVEGKDREEIEKYAKNIADIIEKELN